MKKMTVLSLIIGSTMAAVMLTQPGSEVQAASKNISVEAKHSDSDFESAKQNALQEIIDVTNLLSISTSSDEFTKGVEALNQINAAKTIKEINNILADVEGTAAHKVLFDARENAKQEIVSLTNFTTLSSNSEEFRRVMAILNKVSSQKNIDEINATVATVKEQQELKEVKQKTARKIAELTNLTLLDTNSKEFKQIANVITQINIATSVSEVNEIMNKFLQK